MRMLPFSRSMASEVAIFLKTSRNYAPETIECESVDENIQYFEEAFAMSADGGLSFVVQDSNGHICSFVTIDHRINRKGNSAAYVTGLYVNLENEVERIIEKTMQIIRHNLDSNTMLYVNVHPASSDAVAVWQNLGYSYDPSASDFTNCDGERIYAYKHSAI